MVVRSQMMKSLAYWGKNKLVCVDVKNTFPALKSGKRHQNISHVQMSHFYDFFTHKWSQFLLGLASKLSSFYWVFRWNVYDVEDLVCVCVCVRAWMFNVHKVHVT